MVLLAGILAMLVFITPLFAHAAIWDIFSPTMILTSVLRGIAYILSFIFGILFMIANFFVGIAMNFNSQILSSSNALVVVGWKISRDIANLGFVLLIIIIAFATILRIQSYGAKKLLPMLIGAAIIVNFSLTISGVFINFAGTLSQSFLDKMGARPGDYSAFTDSLASAFGPQRLFLPPDNPPPPDPSEQGGAWTGFSAAILISIGNLAFITVFSLIASMVMFLLAGMLMIRFIVLSFLLIIAPIAWLFWVFPALRHLFSKWWNTFFQWVFFQPAMLFFIYLSILSLSFLKDTAQPPSGGGVFGGLSTVITQGMQMVALCGFLIGGVIAAQKMGIAGANAAVGAAKGIGKGAGKYLVGKAGEKYQRNKQKFAQSDAGQKTTGALGKLGGGLGRFAMYTPKWDKNAKGKSFAKKAAYFASYPFLKPLQFLAGAPSRAAEGAAKNLQRSAVKPVKPYEGTFFGSVVAGAKEGSGLFLKKEKRGKSTVEIDLADVRKAIEDEEGGGRDEGKLERLRAMEGELETELARFEKAVKRTTRTMEDSRKPPQKEFKIPVGFAVPENAETEEEQPKTSGDQKNPA